MCYRKLEQFLSLSLPRAPSSEKLASRHPIRHSVSLQNSATRHIFLRVMSISEALQLWMKPLQHVMTTIIFQHRTVLHPQRVKWQIARISRLPHRPRTRKGSKCLLLLTSMRWPERGSFAATGSGVWSHL